MTRPGTRFLVIFLCLVVLSLGAFLPSSSASHEGALSDPAMITGSDVKEATETTPCHSLHARKLRVTRGIARRPRVIPTYYRATNTTGRSSASSSNAVKSNIPWLHGFSLFAVMVFFLWRDCVLFPLLSFVYSFLQDVYMSCISMMSGDSQQLFFQ